METIEEPHNYFIHIEISRDLIVRRSVFSYYGEVMTHCPLHLIGFPDVLTLTLTNLTSKGTAYHPAIGRVRWVMISPYQGGAVILGKISQGKEIGFILMFRPGRGAGTFIGETLEFIMLLPS